MRVDVRRWTTATVPATRRGVVLATALALVVLLSALTLGDDATVGSPPPPPDAAVADGTRPAAALLPGAVLVNPHGRRFRLVPGDTQQSIFQVDRAPRWRFLRMTTTAGVDNRLVTAPVRGLQLRVDSCSVVWRRGPGTTQSGRAFTCPGTRRLLVASGPAVRRVPLGPVRAGRDLHLRLTTRLPWISGNGTQGLRVRLRNTVTTRPAR